MYKILYIVSSLKKTGPTQQLLNIITNLNPIYQPVILTLSPEETDSIKGVFVDNGLEVHSLSMSRFSSLILAKRKIEKFITLTNPDIVHTQGIRPDSFVSSISKFNNKHVSTVRNYPFDDYAMKFGKKKGYIMARRHFKSIKKITHNLVCSSSLSKEFKEKLNFNVDYIRNGVNTDKFFAISKDEKINLKRKLGFSVGTKIFITVGSLIDRKDPITLIKAFNHLNSDDDIKLLIIGEGPLKEKCEGIAKNGDIEFIGNVNNVQDYLQIADFFVSTSLSEGLPNTVLEALAVGLPVCLTDIGPHSEILNMNSKAGILTKVQDVKMLKQQLDRILEFNYSQMAEASKQIVDNNLSAKVMSKNYQKKYLEVIEESY